MDKSKELQKELARLEATRAKIAGDLEKLTGEESGKREALGAAVLGGANTEKLEGELAQIAARKAGLIAAISKADSDLARLRSELAEAEREMIRAELQAGLDQARASLLQSARALVSMQAEAKTLLVDLQKLADRAAGADMPDLKGAADHTMNAFPFAWVDNIASALTSRKPFVRRTPLQDLGAD